MKKNPYLDLDETRDFGFTFSDEEEIVSSTTYANLPDQVEDLVNRLQAVRAIFLPFLENLNQQPNKPMINWPNRKVLLDEHIAKLKKLTGV